MTRFALILAAALAALVLTAAHATAGVYQVQTCRSDSGTALPIADDAGGWHPEDQAGTHAHDFCSGSDPRLLAQVGTNLPAPLGARATWRFAAPPGTYVSALRIEYDGYTRPYAHTDTATQGVIGVDGEAGRIAFHAGSGTVGPSVAVADGRHDRWVAAYALCDAPQDHPPCPADQVHARIAVSRALLQLTDPLPPSSGSPRGSAVDDASWEGTERLAVGLSDAGGGLWRWSLAVDGAEALAGPVDAGSPTCRADRAFAAPRPCPPEADLLLDVDTTTLPAGTHDVTVRVADAAGNQRTVFSARRTIAGAAAPLPHVDDVPVAAAAPVAVAPAARLTARWARTTARTLTVGFAGRPALRGRLTRPDGAPVRGAAIALALRGVDAGGTRTRPDGTFTLVLPGRRPSATVALRHRPSGARASLRLRVRAGLTLRARRRGGRNVLLAGALLGRPLPRGGKVVELQARVRGGRWLTFRTVRTDARGRYRLRYRFRTAHPERYALRARARSSAGYPYATGVSAAIRVKLR